MLPSLSYLFFRHSQGLCSSDLPHPVINTNTERTKMITEVLTILFIVFSPFVRNTFIEVHLIDIHFR